MKTVYGILVDDRDYEVVLKIADALYGVSVGSKDLHGVVRKECARIALKAVEAARKL